MIRLEAASRVYRTGAVAVEALQAVDFELERGEFVAVMGSSGSGKSTMMNILGCLDRPTSGCYFLQGEDVSRHSRDRLAAIRNRTIGFVFQNFHLLPRTSARENVELPLLYAAEGLSWKEMRERADQALRTVGLEDRADHTPSELSGGQQQRVAIARALVTRPLLLLADEPTGNLDSRTTLEIMDTLQRLNRDGLTVVMVTHESEVARGARRVVTLRDGGVQSDRPIDQVLASRLLAELPEEDPPFTDPQLERGGAVR